MEDVLDVYELPYNPERPVVCMDEKPYQLLAMQGNHCPCVRVTIRKQIQNMSGMVPVAYLLFVEPLGGTHHVSVREQRIAFDWAEEIQ